MDRIPASVDIVVASADNNLARPDSRLAFDRDTVAFDLAFDRDRAVDFGRDTVAFGWDTKAFVPDTAVGLDLDTVEFGFGQDTVAFGFGRDTAALIVDWDKEFGSVVCVQKSEFGCMLIEQSMSVPTKNTYIWIWIHFT